VTWHLEPPSFCCVDVASARSFGDVALSCCGSRGHGRRMWVAAIGGGEKIMFGPSWAVSKGGVGDVHGW
jgi:hypothetical protein